MSEIGIAVIGASMRSTIIMTYVKQHPEVGYIAGVYDTIPDRGRFLLDNYGDNTDAVIYDSLEAAVNDDRVQAVFIGTPDNAHVEPAVKALQAGKHVYCEKPLAITLEDCDTIIEAAKKSGAIFYLGMNLRHSPVHEKMHEILESGELGKLLTIEANEYYYGGRTYFRRWNRLRKFGGGLWVTKACHDFDLLDWFAGDKPVKVFATANLSHYKPDPAKGTACRNCPITDTCPDFYDINNPSNDDDRPDVAENARKMDALAEMTEKATGVFRDMCLYNSDKDTFDNGIAVVEYDNDVRATYTVNVVSARGTRQMRLMGTDGAAEGDMETGKITVWKRHTDKVCELDLSDQINSSHGGADDRILADFFHCCETGNKPRSSWAEGRKGIEVALAARDSMDSNAVVMI